MSLINNILKFDSCWGHSWQLFLFRVVDCWQIGPIFDLQMSITSLSPIFRFLAGFFLLLSSVETSHAQIELNRCIDSINQVWKALSDLDDLPKLNQSAEIGAIINLLFKEKFSTQFVYPNKNLPLESNFQSTPSGENTNIYTNQIVFCDYDFLAGQSNR